MFLHFPIYFNYTSLKFFLQIRGFGTVQFLHRPVAMQEGKALCKAPPFIFNEWLACHFFKITAELSNAEGFSGKKMSSQCERSTSQSRIIFLPASSEKFSKNLLFQLK